MADCKTKLAVLHRPDNLASSEEVVEVLLEHTGLMACHALAQHHHHQPGPAVQDSQHLRFLRFP